MLSTDSEPIPTKIPSIAMSSEYHLHNIKFSYPDQTMILDIEDQIFAAGKTTALLGANGAGKSTLLALLTFIIQATAGEIEFFGEKVTAKNCARLRRKIGLVPQNPYLINGSVADNIKLGLKIHGIRHAEREKRLQDILQQFQITAIADRSARMLSGGEIQKIALARMLVLLPTVILLDEPFTHLDRSFISDCEQHISQLQQQHKTIIFTTHNQAQAEKMADSVYNLSDGKLAKIA